MISGLGPREVLQVGMKSELWVTASGERAESREVLKDFHCTPGPIRLPSPFLLTINKKQGNPNGLAQQVKALATSIVT